MFAQSFEPSKLVVESGSGREVAVRQVETADDHAIDRRLDVTAVDVARIARQASAGQLRLAAARQDRHTVPALLPVPNRIVPGRADRRGRKFVVGRLQLLQAGDIGCRLPQPRQQVGEAPIDALTL
jgi:hypothetical protein